MIRDYYVEVKIGKRYLLLITTKRHIEALDYVRKHPAETYPIRIVQVTRKIVFEDNKNDGKNPKSLTSLQKGKPRTKKAR